MPKHIPHRMCVVCRRSLPKQELIRVVRTPPGDVIIDETGKQAGRGAYLCHQAACWQRAAQGKFLDKALRQSLSAAQREKIAERGAELH